MVVRETLKTIGIPRGEIEAIIREVVVEGAMAQAYSVGPEEHIHLTAPEERFEEIKGELIRRLGEAYYGGVEDRLEEVVGRLLRSRGATLAVAESLTGGLICDRITDIPGSSDYFMAGAIAYSNESKVETLGVPEGVMRDRGAVSYETAKLMAEGVKGRFKTTFGLAVTGIAGPTGGSPQKPVGTVYIALATPAETRVEHKLIPGDRRAVKVAASSFALDMLRRALRG